MVLSKRLYIKTYGCQMNVYDSEKMEALLKPLGYAVTDVPESADMVILNTCHIREKATEKAYSDMGRMRELKNERQALGKDMIIAVAGCTAQAEGEQILNRAPYVDMVFGPQSYHLLPEMLAKATRSVEKGKGPGCGVLEVDFPEVPKFDFLPESTEISGPSTFLAIQEGCDKFCHFCCVPYTRGAEYSRPVQDIFKEAKALVAKGAREITLLGQNVNAYHGEAPSNKGEWGLGELSRYLAEIEGLERIRYMTSHPRDVDEALIQAHRDVPQLMPFLHLPVQSGSDVILKAMNRRHTSQFYLDIIAKFRSVRPDIAFSSDFIVGYPGETDQDFEATLDLVRQVNFAQAYSFKYSPRPGTPAAALENQIDEKLKSERLQILQDLLREQQTHFNRNMIGKKLAILLEKVGRHQGQLIGRSPFLQSVHIKAPAQLLGEIVEVEITSGETNSLAAKLITT